MMWLRRRGGETFQHKWCSSYVLCSQYVRLEISNFQRGRLLHAIHEIVQPLPLVANLAS